MGVNDFIAEKADSLAWFERDPSRDRFGSRVYFRRQLKIARSERTELESKIEGLNAQIAAASRRRLPAQEISEEAYLMALTMVVLLVAICFYRVHQARKKRSALHR